MKVKNRRFLKDCRAKTTDFTAGAWVTVRPYHLILKLVARISARIFLGYPLCRNEQWLEISTEFTENGMHIGLLKC